MKDQTWHAFKVRYTGHGHWSAYFDGAHSPLYTTPDLGFSEGHPFLRVLRTNCDNGGTAEMKNLMHLRTATSAGPWSSNTCRLDTDPGKHLEIVSNSHIKVPGGQKAKDARGPRTAEPSGDPGRLRASPRLTHSWPSGRRAGWSSASAA